jgi:hypothetical protein
MPATTKKPKAKTTQTNFATAGKIAKGIEKVMHELYGDPGDKTMPARLLVAVSEWLSSPDRETIPPSLSEFSFTYPGPTIKDILKANFELDYLHDGDMVVKPPPISSLNKIVAPAGTDLILLSGKLGVVDVVTGKAIGVSNFHIGDKRRNTWSVENMFRLKAPRNRGNLTVLRITLSFHRFGDDLGVITIGEISGFVAAIYRN